MRAINIVNFLRGEEPRSPVDLLLPAQEQMKLIVARKLAATWLLQFDALVDGPFVPFLKANMPAEHEVGFWFEMNQKHCAAAGVEWRGRPGMGWDSHPAVAFTIGYTPGERIKLADAAMKTFREIWGAYPKSIASWNLDAITLAHLAKQYGIDAAAVCRDQIATDGFTIWGAPIAGYYPSDVNCWSAATDRAHQIDVPILRMLGQDPVYYYDNQFKLPDGRVVREPDTMEPAWTAGRSPRFVEAFLKMIVHEPAGRFAYAQLGQENNFGWPEMKQAYPMQMDALAKLRDANAVIVETMGDTGRRFKAAFDTTPPQAQVMLSDPFGNAAPAERTIWYQSRFYRANLHFKDDLAYIRDLAVYRDEFPQPFLREATRLHEVHQRLPAVMDGFHWRFDEKYDPTNLPSAGAFFMEGDSLLRLAGEPRVSETDAAMHVELPIVGGRTLRLRFDERTLQMSIEPAAKAFTLAFESAPKKTTITRLEPTRMHHRFENFDYAIDLEQAKTQASPNGWRALAEQSAITLRFAAT